MQKPGLTDFIDIHNHNASPAEGTFIVENLMAHESRLPSDDRGMVYTYGIHPWFLDENNVEELLVKVRSTIPLEGIIAVGEAGFDKLKGPEMGLQRKAFREQVIIAEENEIPVFIHCVRAWDELLMAQKQLKPKQPWMVHGFRGNADLAMQLISKGMYLSFWYDFIMRPESSTLIKSLPVDRIFLETDGSAVPIHNIYEKVATDLGLAVSILKNQIRGNYAGLLNKN